MFAVAMATVGLVIFGLYGLAVGPKAYLTAQNVASQRVISDLFSVKSAAGLYYEANPGAADGDISNVNLAAYYPRGFSGSANVVATLSGSQLYVYSTSPASPNDASVMADQSNCSEIAGVKSDTGVLITSCANSTGGMATLPAAIPAGALVITGSL